MKFNNELSLDSYVAVVNEIANSFFNETSGEYEPHIGELYAMCVYFNNCVETDGTDKIQNPITALSQSEELLKNVEFVENYRDAIAAGWGSVTPKLDFGHAFDNAMEIVAHNKDGMVYIGKVLASVFQTYGNLIVNAIETLDADKVQKIVELASSEKFNADAIVSAFQNSERFKDIINGNGNSDNAQIIQMQKKDSDG